jgi:hypothetical protein
MEDDRHPTCARCDLGGFRCQGYADPELFVDEMPRIQRAVGVYRRRRAKKMKSESYEENSRHMAATEEGRRREPLTKVQEFNHALCHYVPQDMSSFEERIHLSFLCSKLFFGAPARGQKTLVEKPWIYRFALQSTSKSEHGSEQIPMSVTYTLAMKALAKAFYGQIHGQQAIIIEGADLYGRALHSLRGDLQHSNSYQSSSLLASLMTVYLYEVGRFSL